MVFVAKTGNVTFDHAAHAKRVKEDCKTCHHAGGVAFESKGNCTSKCHVKTAAKKG